MRKDNIFLQRYCVIVFLFALLGMFDSANFAKQWYATVGVLVATSYLVFILFNVYALFHLLLFGHSARDLVLPIYFVVFMPLYIGFSGFVPVNLQFVVGTILSVFEAVYAVTLFIIAHREYANRYKS